MIALLALLSAQARKPDLGDWKDDRCDPEALAGLDTRDASTVASGVISACPGLSEALRGWLEAHGEGRGSEDLAASVCPRAKSEIRGELAPGFEARMLGVGKACRLTGLDPVAASGPQALLLGGVMRDRLLAARVPVGLATDVGRALAGVSGGRAAGRYGAVAAWADAIRLPEVQRATAQLPDGDVYGLDGARRAGPGPIVVLADAKADGTGLAELVDQVADLDDGCWIAVSPPGPHPTAEYAEVRGLQVFGGGRPSAVRVHVAAQGFRVELGAAGAVYEDALDLAVPRAREQLSTAQEFGGEPLPPDRVWVYPDEGVPVARVVEALDALLDADGAPRFAEVVLAREGTLAEWPERVDGLAP